MSYPPPATKAGGTHSPGGEGDGGSIFWKTREIGLPSYCKICTLWPDGTFKIAQPLPRFPFCMYSDCAYMYILTIKERKNGAKLP